MAKENIYSERGRAGMASNEAASRKSLLEFHKSFAAMNQGKRIAPELRREESDSTALADAEALLEEKIAEFAKGSGSLANDAFDIAVARLTMAMFLTERTRKLGAFAMSRDDLGIFSVYSALRTGVCGMLTEKYYSADRDGIFEAYYPVEPVLVACSELCGMKVPPLSDIVVAYKEQLISAASKYL